MDSKKKYKMKLVSKTPYILRDRRQVEAKVDPDRRSHVERRVQIVARGYFDQYYNLYHMMYESKSITDDITNLLDAILNDELWQVTLAQEVSTDKIFGKKKSRDELRAFFKKHGVIEDPDSSEQLFQAVTGIK